MFEKFNESELSLLRNFDERTLSSRERMKHTEMVKREALPGLEVVLTHMEGESQMPEGLKGIIKLVDDFGHICVSWENGSSLSINPYLDDFEIVK